MCSLLKLRARIYDKKFSKNEQAVRICQNIEFSTVEAYKYLYPRKKNESRRESCGEPCI